jgi:hypothetical protein
MSDFGLFASRFRESTSSLKSFDEAIRYFRKADTKKDTSDNRVQLQKLLLVLDPVATSLEGRLSESMNFDELSVVQILRQRRMRNWQRYSENVIRLADELRSGEVNLRKDDFEVLNDVADAVNTECSSLFRRMSGRA